MAKFFDLTTGEYREADPAKAEGDMALAGAHCRRDIERDIDRAMKRIRLEKRAKEKAESKQFVADRKRAKELLAEHGENMAHFAFVNWAGEDEPTMPKMRKWLKSEAWFNPRVVIELAERMKQEGKL